MGTQDAASTSLVAARAQERHGLSVLLLKLPGTTSSMQDAALLSLQSDPSTLSTRTASNRPATQRATADRLAPQTQTHL